MTKKKVLIVEDDFYIRSLYKLAFEKKKYDVVEAENGPLGLEKIKKDSFLFIILDVMLPGMSGLEVLKQAKLLTTVPIYVLTNVGDEEILKQAEAENAAGYFLKVDYTPHQLIEAIEKKQEEQTK